MLFGTHTKRKHLRVKIAASFVTLMSAITMLRLTPPPVLADPATPTAAQILDGYITATGGKAAYEKMTSTVRKGTFSLAAQKINGSFEEQTKAPNKIYISQTIEGFGKSEQGYDGTTGWARDAISGLRVLAGAELTQMKEQARFNGLLAWKEMYSKTEVLGIRTVGAAKAYAIRLTPATGKPTVQYFDVSTKLLLRMDQVVESPQGSIPTESYLSNWKVVDGIKQPFTIRQIVAGSNEIMMTTTSIKSNVPIPDATFAKPADATAPKK